MNRPFAFLLRNDFLLKENNNIMHIFFYAVTFESCYKPRISESHCLHSLPVPEEKYLTLDGFHKFAVDRAKLDIRSVWRAILACGYDLHFER